MGEGAEELKEFKSLQAGFSKHLEMKGEINKAVMKGRSIIEVMIGRSVSMEVKKA